MLAGRLDIDVDFGVGAIVPRIKNKIPIVVFGIHASHLSNAVVVRPGSDIDDVSKLAGKTVGVPLATSAHYTLATVVLEGTGKSLQELGVKLVNMTPAEGIKMPAGPRCRRRVGAGALHGSAARHREPADRLQRLHRCRAHS